MSVKILTCYLKCEGCGTKQPFYRHNPCRLEVTCAACGAEVVPAKSLCCVDGCEAPSITSG